MAAIITIMISAAAKAAIAVTQGFTAIRHLLDASTQTISMLSQR
jgi:hypothetical protein